MGNLFFFESGHKFNKKIKIFYVNKNSILFTKSYFRYKNSL